MDAVQWSLLLLVLALFASVSHGKNQQLYIQPENFINFKYLTTMFTLLVVALVAVMAVIIFLNVLIEDLYPNWKVRLCGGGKDLGDDPFAAQGRRGSTSGNVGSCSAATSAPAGGKKKAGKKSTTKAISSKGKDSKQGKKKAAANTDESKSKQGKDSKAKDSKAKDSKASSAAKGGGSSVAARK